MTLNSLPKFSRGSDIQLSFCMDKGSVKCALLSVFGFIEELGCTNTLSRLYRRTI